MENLLQQAEMALQNGDYSLAENSYFAAIQKQPGNINLWLRLYEICQFQQNDYSLAFACLLKILVLEPFDFSHIKEAIKIFQLLSFDEELNAYKVVKQTYFNNKENTAIRILFAKILILKAKNIDSKEIEISLLNRAKKILNRNININVNINNNNALLIIFLLKSQIELYLAQNSLTDTSLSKNDFSTRNQKNFLAAKSLLEQFRNDDFFNAYLTQKSYKNIVAFFTLGRAGSTFLHSLLDGYPFITTLPLHFMYSFFDKGTWNKLQTKVDKDWRISLISNFCDLYAVLFDARSKTNIPKWNLDYYGKFMGLCNMGNSNQEIFKINKYSFCEYLYKELLNFSDSNKISITEFFILVHNAYDYALNRNLEIDKNQQVLFYNLHFYDLINANILYKVFQKIKLLFIIREPIQLVESHFKACINKTDPNSAGSAIAMNIKPENLLLSGGKNLLNSWQNMVLSLFELCDFENHLNLLFCCDQAKTIRLEDIKNNPKTALINLLKWLGVKNATWHQSLERETFGDFLYAGASQNKIKGFDNSHLKKGQGTFFSQNDLRIMNLMLYPLCVKFGYRPKDNDYLQKEIAWYENVQKVETYMDFEIKIIDRLKQDFPNFENSEAMAPYFYRVKWAKRTINYMKKYQENCVGFAELLGL